MQSQDIFREYRRGDDPSFGAPDLHVIDRDVLNVGMPKNPQFFGGVRYYARSPFGSHQVPQVNA